MTCSPRESSDSFRLSSLAHQLLDKVMASVQHFIGFIFVFSLKALFNCLILLNLSAFVFEFAIK